MTKFPLGDAIAVVCSAGLAIAAWQWRATMVATAAPPAPPESWEHVRQAFPMPSATVAAGVIPADALTEVVEANPFSPLRRQAPSGTQASTGPAKPPTPPPPQWVYKGRAQMGAREVAVLADATSGKTHFVQVGQEIGGCKVVEIVENRVVIQDLTTLQLQELTSAPKPSATSAAPKPATP